MSEELPVILVSAVDCAEANKIISELIEEEQEGSEERVWEISNKYYTARVRLVARGDGGGGGAGPRGVAAHVAGLGAREGAEELSRRAAAAAPAAPAVRLALCAAAPPPGLRAAAAALRYEALWRAAPPPPRAPAGPFPELAGLARAREALHAHPWPGLQLRAPRPRAPPALPPIDAEAHSESSSGAEDGEGGEGAEEAADGEEAEEAACVRRLEQFAAALGAAEAARGAALAAPRDPARLARAEHLLHAFAAALGTDLHRL